MQLVFSAVLALATAALAVPAPSKVVERRAVPTYNPNIPVTIFTNATCTLSKYLTPGEELTFAFPLADLLGSVVSPVLAAALGPTVVNDIDIVAEDLCVDAQQDPADGNGICQDAEQAISDFVNAKDQAAADKYRCLLNLLCVANESPQDIGTCNALLAGSDCVANRIVGVGDPECDGTGFKFL
ncbi:MAG: hypothetical protein M1821_007369 [Bathelium mastoideum]|nr:MAG: hypothetical protein M1821_007369 [Bathelium mastoideum]KAI9694874.1 MAG: hypothetical protein M1822_000490 [Bathelium mastoideum]